MKYLLGIFYVNGLPLLERALGSVRPLRPSTFVLDNSGAPDLEGHPLARQVEVVRPPVPLTFSQSMNCLFRLAEGRGAEVALVLHTDAEALGDTAVRLLEAVARRQRGGRPWGVAFTNYDSFAAFNLAAVRAAGPWDVSLPQYFADNDYYRRLALAGYEALETGLPVRHETSSTLRASPGRSFLNSVTFPLHQRYYVLKWGGPPGGERFAKPFNAGPPAGPPEGGPHRGGERPGEPAAAANAVPPAGLPPPAGGFAFPHDVEGWLFESEGRRLAELAAGRRVLEVGSWYGRSTVCLAQTAAVVHAVDWHRGDAHAGFRDTLAPFLANLRRHGVADRVVVHVGRFEDVAPVLAPVFDLVFVDAHHGDETVRRHVRLAVRLLSAGGALAFHDYGCPLFPAVKAGVDRLAHSLGLPVETVDTLAVLEGVGHRGGLHEPAR